MVIPIGHKIYSFNKNEVNQLDRSPHPKSQQPKYLGYVDGRQSFYPFQRDFRKQNSPNQYGKCEQGERMKLKEVISEEVKRVEGLKKIMIDHKKHRKKHLGKNWKQNSYWI